MSTDLGALLSWRAQYETVVSLGDRLFGGHLADTQYLVCIQSNLQHSAFPGNWAGFGTKSSCAVAGSDTVQIKCECALLCPLEVLFNSRCLHDHTWVVDSGCMKACVLTTRCLVINLGLYGLRLLNPRLAESLQLITPRTPEGANM